MDERMARLGMKLPGNLGKEVIVKDPKATTEPVGRLGDYVGQTFRLKDFDDSGREVEWVVKPTGSHSFELTVPEGRELGVPEAWESISIMAQRVVCRSGSCGCDGSQCGCQGSQCSSNSKSILGRIRLVGPEEFNLGLVAELRKKVG